MFSHIMGFTCTDRYTNRHIHAMYEEMRSFKKVTSITSKLNQIRAASYGRRVHVGKNTLLFSSVEFKSLVFENQI